MPKFFLSRRRVLSSITSRGTLLLILVSSLIGILTVWTLRQHAIESTLVELVNRQIRLQHRHLNEILLVAQGYEVDYRATQTALLATLERLRHGDPVIPAGPTEEIRQVLAVHRLHLRNVIANADAYLHAHTDTASAQLALEKLLHANRQLYRTADHTARLYQAYLVSARTRQTVVTLSVAISVVLLGALMIPWLKPSNRSNRGHQRLIPNSADQHPPDRSMQNAGPYRGQPAEPTTEDHTRANPSRPTSASNDTTATAVRVAAMEEEPQNVPAPTVSSLTGFEEMIGTSPKLLDVCEQIKKVAGTDATVLLTGETGTGKELAARAIHRLSKRQNHVFMTVNCANLPAPLIESELFGHEKGAFTSATSRVRGRFELANGGTLVLDEIAELPLETQSKLLRVLQDRQFERLGGTQTLQVDVRIIAATNRRLEEAVHHGAFRPDLFFRLNTFPITIPPLRERKEDIPLLATHFLKTLTQALGKPVTTISPLALDRLRQHDWPGNVRELANAIERAIILCDGSTLLPCHFEALNPLGKLSSWRQDDDLSTLHEAERAHILKALQKTHGVVGGPKGAAALLGINRNTLLSRMKKLGVTSSLNHHRDRG